MNENEKRSIDTGSIVGGLFLIGIGVLFLLDRFTAMDFSDLVWHYWPVVFFLIGIPKLFRRETFWSGLWLIALGAWFQVVHLRLYGLTYRNAWPLLLILMGAGTIMRALTDATSRPREEKP